MLLNGFLDVNVCLEVFVAVLLRVLAWEKSMLSRWVFLVVGSPIVDTILWVMLMEWKALIEQDKQDLEEISVSNL